VVLDDIIVVYGGIGPFCYEFCKDTWVLNITTNQWQSDIYKRGLIGAGTGDGIEIDHRGNKILSYKSKTRPLSWSFGAPDDPKWRLHAYNAGYRNEEDPDARYRIPERRMEHVSVPYIEPAKFIEVSYNHSIVCQDHTRNSTVNESGNLTNYTYTNYTCNETRHKWVWKEKVRWMYMYGGFGGAKKTDDITVQKSTYYTPDIWKLDVDTATWYKIEPHVKDNAQGPNGAGPGKRRGHAATIHGDIIYMFGGKSDFVPKKLQDMIYESTLLVLDDMWGFNITNNTWFLITPITAQTDRWGYDIPHHLVDTPHGRHGHKMTTWDDIIYLFGGYYDPVMYYDDTWHYNITSRVWLQKTIQGVIPSHRYQFAIAMWNNLAVIHGGYGSNCDWVTTGSPGLYCQPNGQAYYLGDTWHYSQKVCPTGCNRNGTCHYGSCICGPDSDGVDCSNYTCPDCVTMYGLSDFSSMACEIWDAQENPVIQTTNPIDPAISGVPAVTGPMHPFGAGIEVQLANASRLHGNCYYDFGIQKKCCRSCSIRGECMPRTGMCVCDPMFSNFDCSYMACPHPTCNNGGICLLNGMCVCRYGTFESDCEINFECPNDCSYRGICLSGGICRCYDSFYGVDCSIEIAFSGVGKLVPSVVVIAFFGLISLITLAD